MFSVCPLVTDDWISVGESQEGSFRVSLVCLLDSDGWFFVRGFLAYLFVATDSRALASGCLSSLLEPI